MAFFTRKGLSVQNGGDDQQPGFGIRLAKAGSWSILGKFAGRLIDLFTLIILTNALQPTDFGLVAQAMTVIIIVEAVTSMPIGQPLLRMKAPEGAAYDTGFTLTFLRAIGIGVIIIFLSHPLAAFFHEPRLPPLLAILALAPILRGCISPLMVEFIRSYNLRPEAMMDIFSKLASLAVVIIMVWLSPSYWAIIAATVTTPAVLCLMSYALAPYRPRLSLKYWRSFADVIGWNAVIAALNAIFFQIDRVLLGRALGNADFGRYAVSRTFVDIPHQAILAPLTRPMTASFAQTENEGRRQTLWLKCAHSMFFIVGPVLVTMAILAEQIIFIVTGPDWKGAGVYLSGLALALLPSLPNYPLNTLAISMYRTGMAAQRVFIQFSITIPLMIVFVQWHGAVGAIVARGAISIFMLFISAFFVRRLLNLSVARQLAVHWRTAVGLAAMALVMLLFRDFVAAESSRLMAAVKGGIVFSLGGVTYLAVNLGLWRIFGMPQSLESIFVTQCNAVMQSYRNRRASRTPQP
ncbi:oligosaccharide flippase family protein [Hyphococcus sp.]|uniref:oligosaccharide flippase family protein n=1 Tax=Hyphococcus sp. TaxID=2038636 RepID=UPI0035C78465